MIPTAAVLHHEFRKPYGYLPRFPLQTLLTRPGPVDLKQKEKDVNNKLQLYGIVEGR